MIEGAVAHRVRGAGVELAAVELGPRDAPAVLLVHGYPDSLAVWSAMAPLLARRHRVLAYDVRGAGGSSRPARTADYDLELLVADAVAVIEALAPGQAVHLVGHDWGSIQGWAIAASPAGAARLRSFTSISGPSLDHVGDWFRERLRGGGRRAALVQALRSWYVGALQLPGLPAALWRGPLGRLWPGYLARREGVPVEPGHPGPTAPRDGADGARLYRRNIPRALRDPRPEAVARVPVQLIVAGRDRYVTPALLEGLERRAPRLRRRELDAGHWVIRTHPAEVAALVEEFVAEVGEGPGA